VGLRAHLYQEPQMAKYKFGLCGPAVVDKTRRAYSLVSRLQSYNIKAKGVFDDNSYLGGVTDEPTQNRRVLEQVVREIKGDEADDADVLVCDSTILDQFALYECTHPNSVLKRSLFSYVRQWMKTYTMVFYSSSTIYTEVDGAAALLIEHEEISDKVEVVDPSQVINSVMRHMKKPRPGLNAHLNATQVQWLSDQLRVQVITRFEADPAQAQEIYFVVGTRSHNQPTEVKVLCEKAFGENKPLAFYFVPDTIRFMGDTRYYTFTPQRTHG
jgi:hypothetical protein